MKTMYKVAGGFLLGIACGAVGGLLSAPQSGKKTRKKISDESKRFSDEMIKSVNSALGSVKTSYNQHLDSFTKTGKSSLEGLKKTLKV